MADGLMRMKDPQKLAALALKVEQLVKSAGPEWTFRHHKADKKERVWEIAGSYVRNFMGKWFRVAMEDVMADDRVLFTQGIVLEEASNFSAGECNKIVGELALPVRRDHNPTYMRGQLMFGLECRRMTGAYGAPVMTVPRCSISNPQQLPQVTQRYVAYETKVRLNGNRLTGVVKSRVVCDLGQQFQNCVWLNEEELYELLLSNQISDAGTRDLAWWALMHRQELAEKFE